ncbi:MAG TPA: PEP-CTERM sorting domain-containing protein [Azonexus sp.]|nr:PEP-CTERM sorting domain-containing protein [Azonexus sp.]
MNRKIIASMLAAAGIAMSGAAQATFVVGGVDFGSPGSHLETTTIAETFVNGNGQHLLGYGVINTVNGASSYTSNGDKLFFTFDYTTTGFTPTSTGFINGVVNVFKGANVNLLNQSSAANWALINGYSQWVRFTGHAGSSVVNPLYELFSQGTLTGSNTISFFGDGLLDVDLSGTFGIAGVAAALNGNDIDDVIGGKADALITTSGNNLILNSHDNTTGCRTQRAAAGQWCVAGSADIRGTVLPEPGSLALAGLGLLGLGAARRRSK